MDASLTALLTSAASQAESILGESFTLGGASYRGVAEEVENLLPPTVTGYEPKRTLMITAVASQFTSAPDASTRPKVVARSTTWNLTAVKPGPLHYHLTCVVA